MNQNMTHDQQKAKKDWQQPDWKIYVEQHGVTEEVQQYLDDCTAIVNDPSFAGGSYDQFCLTRSDGTILTIRAHYRGPVYSAIQDRKLQLEGQK